MLELFLLHKAILLRICTVLGSGTSLKIGSATVATGLYADLSAATAATINQLRQSFQIQSCLSGTLVAVLGIPR